MNEKNFLQFWIPKGFAHGFLTISETAEIEYKVTEYWSKDHERSILWDDNDLNIKWPKLNVSPICSKKDKEAKKISEIKDCDLF